MKPVQSPLAVPNALSVLLTNDPCGAFKGTTASDALNNQGKARFTASVAPSSLSLMKLSP